jgi:hypothetical protein
MLSERGHGAEKVSRIIDSQSKISSEESNALHLVGLEGNPVLRYLAKEPNN